MREANLKGKKLTSAKGIKGDDKDGTAESKDSKDKPKEKIDNSVHKKPKDAGVEERISKQLKDVPKKASVEYHKGTDIPTTVTAVLEVKDNSELSGSKHRSRRSSPKYPPAKHFLTGRLVLAVFISGFCSAFQHGYQTGVVNNSQVVLRSWINNVTNATLTPDEDDDLWEWSGFVSVFNAGGFLGSIVIYFITRHHSKKNGLKLNNMSVIVGVICLGFAKFLVSYSLFVTGRFVVGINAALNSGLATMYLSEISPLSLRGAIMSVYPVSLSFAILASNVLSSHWVLGQDHLWPLLFVVPIGPAVIQIIGIAFCPESPKFLLIEKDDREGARKALKWLRHRCDVDEEIERIMREREDEDNLFRTKFTEMFTNPQLRKPLRIAVLVMLAQQTTGIASVLYFSHIIFIFGGLSADESGLAVIIVSSVNVITTTVALLFMDLAGRRTLLGAGLFGMLITTIGLFVCLKILTSAGNAEEAREVYPALPYVSVACLLGFITAYASGPGPIPWFFVNELFAQRGRTIASAIANCVNWLASFTVALVFPQLFQSALRENVFLIFIGLQLLFLCYICYEVPETKRKAILKIVEDLREDAEEPEVVQGPELTAEDNLLLPPKQAKTNEDTINTMTDTTNVLTD